MKPLGDIFISLIKVTITPLIFVVVVSGIAQVGDMRTVGRIGLKALIYFEGLTTFCLLFSLVVVQFVKPGEGVARANAQQAETIAQIQPGACRLHLRLSAAHGARQFRRRLRERRRAAGAGAGASVRHRPAAAR